MQIQGFVTICFRRNFQCASENMLTFATISPIVIYNDWQRVSLKTPPSFLAFFHISCNLSILICMLFFLWVVSQNTDSSIDIMGQDRSNAIPQTTKEPVVSIASFPFFFFFFFACRVRWRWWSTQLYNVWLSAVGSFWLVFHLASCLLIFRQWPFFQSVS